MIKAELIQASNNTTANVPIFTFRFTYPRRHRLLDFFGLSKYFEKRLTETIISTHTHVEMLLYAVQKFGNPVAYVELHEQVCEIIAFTNKVFTALRGNGRLARTDLQKAADLFGTRANDVLKQYKPGEMHRPRVGWPCTYGATVSGWQFIG